MKLDSPLNDLPLALGALAPASRGPVPMTDLPDPVSGSGKTVTEKCVNCGKEFERVVGPGRPRLKCRRKCPPPRPVPVEAPPDYGPPLLRQRCVRCRRDFEYRLKKGSPRKYCLLEDCVEASRTVKCASCRGTFTQLGTGRVPRCCSQACEQRMAKLDAARKADERALARLQDPTRLLGPVQVAEKKRLEQKLGKVKEHRCVDCRRRFLPAEDGQKQCFGCRPDLSPWVRRGLLPSPAVTPQEQTQSS